MTTKPKTKGIKAWAVIKDGEILDYQNTCYAIYKTRMDGMARKIVSDGKIIPVLITPLTNKKNDKRAKV